jgi:hypothetical protein
MTSNDCYDSH